MIKYPETMVSIGRQDQILAANSKVQPLDKTDYANGESPLVAYKPWSGLTLNFADSKKNIGGSGAIEVNHFADVKLRSEIAMKAIMEEEVKKESNPASANGGNTIEEILDTKVYFLPREINSEFRGKGAFDIVKAVGIQVAMNASQNLKSSIDNNSKYAENNRKQAAALDLAIILVNAENTLYDGQNSIATLYSGDMNKAFEISNQLFNAQHPAGKVAAELFQAIKQYPSIPDYLKSRKNGEVKSNGIYRIYGPILKTPNVKKVDNDGYTKAYSLSIYCNPKQLPYPFHVELQTMKGKPLPNHAVGVDGNTITDRKTFSIDLQTWEWLNVINRADWEAKLVALWAHNEQYAESVKATNENRMATTAPTQQPQYTQPNYYNNGYNNQPQRNLFTGYPL